MHLPKWFSPPQLEQDEQTRQARNLFIILVSVFLFEIIFGLLTPIVFSDEPIIAWLFIGIALAYTATCYVLMQKGRIMLASILFCAFLGVSTMGSALASNGVNSFTIQTFTVVVLIAGFLLGPRQSFFYAIFGSISILLIYFAEAIGIISIPQTSLPIPLKIAIPIFVFIMSALLVSNITQTINRAFQKVKQNEIDLQKANSELKTIQATSAQQAENRSAQLQASVTIGQMLSSLLDPDEIGNQVIQQLTTLFDYDFASIYFLDDTGKWVTLKYSNQETPSSFKVGIYRIDLTQSNSIANAIRTQKTYVTSDLINSSETNIPLQSSNIQTEITLPLQTRRRLLGAINLQAYQPLIFNSHDIDTLQNVANQIASAFDNAKLFNETQKQFQEISRLNQFYLQTTWRALLTEDTPAYHFSMGELDEMKKSDDNVLKIAQKEQKIHIKNENGNSTLIAPIMFQEQILGAVQLTSQDRIWTPDEMILIDAVLNQTALSLENTRLITETRSRAEQEKMISNISSHMRETLDLETILQTTAQEMQKTFKLSEVEIRLLPLTQTNLAGDQSSTSGE